MNLLDNIMTTNAIVKSIVSGDTIVIKPYSSLENENEQRISLNYITAPKLARPPIDKGATSIGSTIDEPYAFEAREYLRKKLVGQEICYTIDFRIPYSNRLMCTVYLGKDKETGENINESLLSEGLVELRQQIGIHANDSKYQRLILIDKQAKINKRGRYSDELPNNHIRNMKWILNNPKEFVDQHKSSSLDAIVEFIRDGNTVRCLLLPSYDLVTIQLTGIKCPINETNEPFAEEAKQYVEKRLLQRQVKVLLEGVNKQYLFGTLLHPNGNIAYYLLQNGLARCVDRSLILLDQPWREKYRDAEKFAKDNRLKIWRNYMPESDLTNNDNNTVATVAVANEKSNDPSLKRYQAKVLEVINGDALIIRDLRDNEIRRIYLSSVRAPHATDFQQEFNKNNRTAHHKQIKRPFYEIPYLFEAREFLRTRLIGKNIRVIDDYIRPANNDYPEKICCTVYIENVDIGEALISEGLATAVRHQRNDKQRSSRYNDLLAAEQQAKTRAVGLFSTDRGLHRVVDMTGENNIERAKVLLPILQRNGCMEGVIEFVASGSRFRIHLLKDHWIISFVLASINCPRAEQRIPLRNNSQEQKIIPGEPLGDEALAFSKEHFLRRNVFIHVKNMEHDYFIGSITTIDGQQAALMLVQAGFAKFYKPTPNVPNDKQSFKKKERITIEVHCKQPLSTNIYESEIINFNDPEFHRVVLTYITSELTIYVQYSEQGQKLEQLQNQLREIFNEKTPIGEYTPKKGELLAARFTADDQWYRAKVEKIEENNHIFVYFIDYGNREVITDLTRITTLPSDFSELPSQAYKYELAYVRVPSDEDDRQYAKNNLLDDIGNDECLIKVEYQQNHVEFISLYRESTKKNLVKNLAEQGLIIIDNNHQKGSSSLYEQLQQAQTIAKSLRRGLWQYSDQINDDANE